MIIGDKIIDALRANPAVLGLVVINVLFLGYVIHEVGASASRKDALIAELTRECGRAPKGDRQ
jgi:hypothetical protein